MKYMKWQLRILVLLRVLIGWHFLYEGMVKVVNPDWSSIGYLLDSKWIFAGFFHSLAANPGIVAVVDFLNIWGLILVGLGLILGCLTRVATLGGILMLAFYYLSHPPFLNLEYVLPGEGSYLIINKTLIELVALWLLFLFPTGMQAGLDRFIFRKTSPGAPG
jgi:thiosulfate dehydrogenase [quinone] large subunit